ncbi:MAG TPA: choice-of-anchor Q domain-containing protein [Euzebyales bacterium]
MAALFSMCLFLTACDMESVLQLTGPGAGDVRGRSGEHARDDRRTGSGGQDDESGDAADDPTVTDAGGDSADDGSAGDGGTGPDASAADTEDPLPADSLTTEPAPTGGDGGASDGTESFACDHTLAGGVEEADGAGNFSDVGPGDTVCLASGTRGPLELRNFHGADGRPVTFVNSGGTVQIRGDDGDYAGIEIEDSDHIRVTGAGAGGHCGADIAAGSQRCGISILGTARSLTGKVKTEHIRVDHVEMGDTSQSAVSIKDNSMGRGEWIEHDVVLDHNYLHDVKDEGVYIGSSDYATGDYHVLHGVRLSHNLVVRTGRDGLQVGSATRDCAIHDNVVTDTGRNGESSHRAGVMNNKGSVCDIHDNVISDTAGWGIYIQGNGSNDVYNNVVIRAGRAVSAGDDDGDGITVHDGSNTDGSVRVLNNTVVGARGDGIGWSNDVGSDNQIRNNIAVGSGGVDVDRDANVDIGANLTGAVSAVGFVDPSGDDFRLGSASPAVDAGRSLRSEGVVDDIDGTARPQGSAYDIGAYERTGG